MKIDPHCQQQRCSRMTLDSGNIRFMRIFEGFPGEEASNDSGVIESRDFQGFRTLCRWYLSKWGQHYYVVLFSPLLPFHWPQNTWPWMVEWPFYVKFSLLRTGFFRVLLAGFDCIFYLFTVESIYVSVTCGNVGSGVADRDPQTIWNPRKNCGSFRRRYMHRRNLNK